MNGAVFNDMNYFLLFIGQAINFLIAVVNIRAATRGYIKLTMASDFLFSAVNFLLVQHIAKANNWGELLSYATGGAIGSATAILLTRRWDTPDR